MATPKALSYPCTTVAVSINRPADEVYAFAREAENLPAWAGAFIQSIKPATDAPSAADEWIAQTNLGAVRFKFAPRNTLGVLDHDVTLATGETFYNPMRVIPNGAGSTVLFTVFDRGSADFESDLAMIRRDLETLKKRLEA